MQRASDASHPFDLAQPPVDMTGCVPKVCSPMSCDDMPNGCGTTLHCGGCKGKRKCGGGGIPNICD